MGKGVYYEEQLIEDLILLLEKYEGGRLDGATWDNLSKQTKKQIKGIVGFKVDVDKLEATYKLSQTRKQRGISSIVINLKQNDNHQMLVVKR